MTTTSLSPWRESFSFNHVKVLVVGRGPVRLEAVEAFDRMGAQPTGILLSEKDSVVYPRALAPELRQVGRAERVHRVPDYAGAGAEEKGLRIGEILDIARKGHYTHIFAGYGFMAEDHEFIQAVEEAGFSFVGPSSDVARRAGSKDAAKALARSLDVSVTPGLDNILALTLLAQAKDSSPQVHLKKLAEGLSVNLDETDTDEAAAEILLTAAMAKGRELVTLEEITAQTEFQVQKLLAENPGKRLRLKHVGGGGGKGQRLVATTEAVSAAVFEVLSESKALGPGDNRNFLIELNVEETRHNEIQLLGNGTWCIALGGRDCSLQMHEQKLLEVSVTQEELTTLAESYEKEGKKAASAVLAKDGELLGEMEGEAERFGAAVGLNSASTFEVIVAADHHYFMEINTRIQVEHRVTEMVYSLKFTHPEKPDESFVVESLVEAMLWMAVHGSALPRPERIPRHGSGAEVRINATNDALRPHAGGVILNWSQPGLHELRDDQGIGIPNPDTGTFIPYNLAGAYDSNAALVVTCGANREETYQRLSEALRLTELRGEDVMTNLPFHYGLLQWMMGFDPMVKPSTRFVEAYLAAVGALKIVMDHVDMDIAWGAAMQKAGKNGENEQINPSAQKALGAKLTLILRPLKILIAAPHLLAGWLAPRPHRRWNIIDHRVVWQQNPVEVMDQLYHFLRLEEHPGVAPDEQMWDHDRLLLDDALAFYAELKSRLGSSDMDWARLKPLLEGENPPNGIDEALWEEIQNFHRGFSLGLSLLEIPVLLGEEAGFAGLEVGPDLEPVIPSIFHDPQHVPRLQAALLPPAPQTGNSIQAFTGGAFFSRPGPDQDPYVKEGAHFEMGDVVGLLEVMKMFNPIRAEFAGTVKRALISSVSGVLVHKGQVLFEVEPDHPVEIISPEKQRAQKTEKTLSLMKRLSP